MISTVIFCTAADMSLKETTAIIPITTIEYSISNVIETNVSFASSCIDTL